MAPRETAHVWVRELLQLVLVTIVAAFILAISVAVRDALEKSIVAVSPLNPFSYSPQSAEYALNRYALGHAWSYIGILFGVMVFILLVFRFMMVRTELDSHIKACRLKDDCAKAH